MTAGWSIFTHDDLPPLAGSQAPAPLEHVLPGSQVPSLPPLPPAETERLARQRQVARVVRYAAEPVDDRRCRRMLADRALLVEAADSSDEVLALLAEIEALGVKVGRKP